MKNSFFNRLKSRLKDVCFRIEDNEATFYDNIIMIALLILMFTGVGIACVIAIFVVKLFIIYYYLSVLIPIIALLIIIRLGFSDEDAH